MPNTDTGTGVRTMYDDPVILNTIIRLLGHDEVERYKKALDNLSGDKNEKAAALLLELLISHWKDESCVTHLMDQCYSCEELNRVLALFDNYSANFLLEATRLGKFSLAVRRKYASLLGYFEQVSVLDKIFELINDEDAIIRSTLVLALSKFNDSQTLNTVVQILLNDKDSFVRKDAAEALADLDNEQKIEVFLLVLKDSDSDVRNTVIEVLGVLGDERAVQPLLQVADNDNGKTWLGKRLSLSAFEASALLISRLQGTVILQNLKYSQLRKIIALEGKFFSH